MPRRQSNVANSPLTPSRTGVGVQADDDRKAAKAIGHISRFHRLDRSMAHFTEVAHSPSHAWKFGDPGTGNYANHADGALISPSSIWAVIAS